MSLVSMYLDDSDGTKQGQKFCVWGGLIINEGEAIKIQDDLCILKKKWGLNKYDPIKWSPKENKKTYNKQRNLTNQNDFKAEVLDLIANSELVLISAVFVNDKGLSKSAMEITLMNDLAVRFQFDLQDKQKIKGSVFRGAFIIATGNSNTVLSSSLINLHKKGAYFNTLNLQSQNKNQLVELKNIEHAPYFSFEEHNPLLQLADFVSGCISWSIKNDKHTFFDIIKHKFRTHNNKIKGAGILVYPNNSNFIASLLKR